MPDVSWRTNPPRTKSSWLPPSESRGTSRSVLVSCCETRIIPPTFLLNQPKKARPYAKGEPVTRGTTSIELEHSSTHAVKQDLTAPLANGEVSGQLLADTLRWVRQGSCLPAFTLPARCPALPSSTDPDQRAACVLFVVPRILLTLCSVKFYRAASECNLHSEAAARKCYAAGDKFPARR